MELRLRVIEAPQSGSNDAADRLSFCGLKLRKLSNCDVSASNLC